jgi:cytochrome P450
MSIWDMHHNETYFPDAGKFDPTRWLDPKESRRMAKAFVPFSKGSRACAGIKYVSIDPLNCLPTELIVWHIANYTLH